MMSHEGSQHRLTGEGWSIRTDATGRLHVTFWGYTQTRELDVCLRALSTQMRDHAELIIDIRELDGHNIETREQWKRWLANHKSQVRSVTVVLARAMVLHKMVTAAIGLAVGLRITVAEEVP